MSNIKIIVCCHKKDIFKESDTFLPIQVGKSLANSDLGFIGDDTGENISWKNASYCELTGMYWAWKNLKGVDYIGLCHYRRYFDFNHIGRKYFPLTTIETEKFNLLNLEINDRSIEWLDKGGWIVAKPVHLYTSLYFQYCGDHISTDFKVLGDAIRNTLPHHFFQAFWDSQMRSNIFSPYNMFIMPWSQFDKYCNWLFGLLKSVEDEIDISNYSSFQKRVFGYLAERLLNLYIYAEGIRTMKIPILKISDEPEIDDISTLKYFIRTVLRDFAMKVTKQ